VPLPINGNSSLHTKTILGPSRQMIGGTRGVHEDNMYYRMVHVSIVITMASCDNHMYLKPQPGCIIVTAASSNCHIYNRSCHGMLIIKRQQHLLQEQSAMQGPHEQTSCMHQVKCIVCSGARCVVMCSDDHRIKCSDKHGLVCVAMITSSSGQQAQLWWPVDSKKGPT
jgi:hypothetical protein